MDNSPPAAPEKPFWQAKTLAEMTEAEWESLCDGCGKCCLLLLEEDTMEGEAVLETSLCCRLFDGATRTCRQYADRHSIVPGCVQVTPANAGTLEWMPESCAYRRLAEGRSLADWHPLVSGRRESVVEAGIAVPDNLKSEKKVRARHYHRYVTGVRSTR
ncbi:YcgN family cysteine cluster protein [Parvularcula sp. LCG005]|uniref:YcgN family cysteine cluster protein n=1 Tax=Parvularcula sp. LCG005 TaxID=3078805 RepID=UPI002941FC23|nr:YcgN family cysteine cluster protein [Parvularcula sp. LCG005]WOI53987.1 YcgN family cysteine cluster protein [Parvularcula sp. LCG005]